MIAEDVFIALFRNASDRKMITRSLIPYNDNWLISAERWERHLSWLVGRINSGAYYPSPPRNYITYNRNGVPRFVPTFTIEDTCVFYFCVQQLQSTIARNRTYGTFGGFQMGGEIRRKEREEIGELNDIVDIVWESPYASVINPLAWSKEWKEFRTVAYRFARQGDYSTFCKFDISSFFDTINLDRLERLLRDFCEPNSGSIIDLLFVFLRHWNRGIEGYSSKTVGLPQAELTDCSRLLANFYLQGYDALIAADCEAAGAKFVRYADDQIIMAYDKSTASRLLFRAGKHLHRLGLNVNSGKTAFFENASRFADHWAFDIFSLLEKKSDPNDINEAIELMLKRYSEQSDSLGPTAFSPHPVLRRLLSVGINDLDVSLRTEALNLILQPSFLATARYYELARIHKSMFPPEQKFLIAKLDEMLVEQIYDSFHLNVRAFYKGLPPAEIDPEYVEGRIWELYQT